MRLLTAYKQFVLGMGDRFVLRTVAISNVSSHDYNEVFSCLDYFGLKKYFEEAMYVDYVEPNVCSILSECTIIDKRKFIFLQENAIGKLYICLRSL